MEEQTISVSLERADELRKTFTDNDALLKSIRNLFYGFTITDSEKALIQTTFKDNEVLKTAVKNKIYQTLSPDNGIGSNPDFWIGVEQTIQGQHPDTVKQVLASRESCLDMLEFALTLLDDPHQEVKSIATYRPDENDTLGVELIARNLFIKSVEQGLSYIKIVCGLSPEQIEEARKAAQKDETK